MGQEHESSNAALSYNLPVFSLPLPSCVGPASWYENNSSECQGCSFLSVMTDFTLPTPPPHSLSRWMAGKAVGLVLSGGGSRGLAHLGVLRALEDLGIPVDVVGGTSQGAFMAGLYAQGLDRNLLRVRRERTSCLC